MPTKFVLELPAAPPLSDPNSRPRKPITVTMRDPVKPDRRGARYQTEFTLKIPDAIWNQLRGKKLPCKKKGSSERDSIEYSKDVAGFPKTLANTTLMGLCMDWERLIANYIWSKQLDKYELERVIFYQIGGAREGFAYSSWHNKTYGDVTSAKLVYTLGRRTVIPQLNSRYRKYEGEFRYTLDGDLIPSYNNEAFYDLKWIKWTEKREQFFDALQASFNGLVDRLGIFEDLIKEETIDQMVERKIPLLKA